MNSFVWWTGAAVLLSVGAIGAAAFIAVANVLTVWIVTHYAKRFGNVNKNLSDMKAWVANGKPQWRQEGGRFVLVPIDNEVSA